VTPDLFAALSDAGFGDQIVLASSSFPSATLARPSESASLIRMDGQTVETVLEEIMKFIKVNLFSRFFKVFENTYRKITFLILIVTVTFHRRIQLFNI
jgi:L-fucose mutarotase/ribose pyranase (RbsD/FucU family)